jgi:microsomal prostaglandin-E synthase 2
MSAQSTPDITLYQFQLCPFCHKVRAALELKGLSYRSVEVAPGNKKELPAELPAEAPRKVPVMRVGEQLLWDSTEILRSIDRLAEGALLLSELEGGQHSDEALQFEDWVDDELMPALPTVIYDTWGNAMRAAQITARESNFGAWDAFKVRVGGSLIMKLIVKRILKRKGRSDGHSWLAECLSFAEAQLGDQDFVTGPRPTIADAALHGAFKCVEEFPVFEQIKARPSLYQWFERVQALRDA